MALFNSYILYSLNTEKPVSRKMFLNVLVDKLFSDPALIQDDLLPQENTHDLAHLPGRKERTCPVCGKRSLWYCTGCNCVVHPICFLENLNTLFNLCLDRSGAGSHWNKWNDLKKVL